MSSNINRNLPGNAFDAAIGANSPSISNVFATIADLPQAVSSGTQLLTGGASWSGTGMVFDVTVLTYQINGVNYTSSATSVTLSVGDPSDPRFDAIVVDEFGVVSVITGSPSANPVTPTIPGDQVLVQYVLVNAGAITPAITDEWVYRESQFADWTGSLSTPAGSPTANFSSSSPAPFDGAACLLASYSAYSTARYIRLQAPTPINRATYVGLSLRVYLLQDLSGPSGRRPFVTLRGSGTNLLGSRYLEAHGLNLSLVGVWQQVTIPTALFGGSLAQTTINSIQLSLLPTNGIYSGIPSVQIAYDNIVFQTGFGTASALPTIDILDNGTVIGSTGNLNFIDGTNTTAVVTQDILNNKIDVQIDAAISSGVIGIADSNGAFTYYSTLAAACTAAVSGQTITLFTDVTETTATAAILPNGVDLNLNGNSYILDVAGVTNAIETAGGGSRNTIYNGKIIRRNVGGSSFSIGLCLRNRNAVLNLYGVDLINEDNCTALLIEESGTVNGSWSARCDGTASGVTVASGYTPLVYNGKITSGDIGVYVDSGSTINLYYSYIESSSSAIQSVGIGIELNNSTVFASANTAIELPSGTLLIDRSLIIAGSGGAINVSSGIVDISLSRIFSVGADAISIGAILGNLKIVGSHISTLNGTNNFLIGTLQAYKVDISNNYFFIQGTATRRNLSFATTSDAGNATLDIKNNTLEVVSSGIAGSSSNIYFGNYLSGFYKVSGNEFKCTSPSAASRCIKTNGFALTMAYISNVLGLTNGQNPIDSNITQGNGFTPDLYGNIQTDY